MRDPVDRYTLELPIDQGNYPTSPYWKIRDTRTGKLVLNAGNLVLSDRWIGRMNRGVMLSFCSCVLRHFAPVPAPAPKRGRGRPRKPDALTAAQRARRYRQRQELKRTMLAKIQTMTHGEASKLRRAQPKGTLAFSVLCELTMAHLRFPAVTA